MKKYFVLMIALVPFSLPSFAQSDDQESLPSFAQSDSRQSIPLNAEERIVILTEMRGLLAGLQEITAALAANEMAEVARVAKSLGMQMVQIVPLSIRQKLPRGFKQLGFAVHQDFDLMALDAQNLGESQQTLVQLGDTLAKCVACHAAYQITVK